MPIIGYEAIQLAETHGVIGAGDHNGVALHKQADPVTDGRLYMTLDEARVVASRDPSLVYCAWRRTRELRNGAVIDDRRDPEAMLLGTPPKLGYAIATNTALAGWNHGAGRCLFAFAVDSLTELQAVESGFNANSDMKRPRWVVNLRKDGTPQIALRSGDHLLVRDRETAERWYVENAFAA